MPTADSRCCSFFASLFQPVPALVGNCSGFFVSDNSSSNRHHSSSSKKCWLLRTLLAVQMAPTAAAAAPRQSLSNTRSWPPMLHRSLTKATFPSVSHGWPSWAKWGGPTPKWFTTMLWLFSTRATSVQWKSWKMDWTQRASWYCHCPLLKCLRKRQTKKCVCSFPHHGITLFLLICARVKFSSDLENEKLIIVKHKS